MEILLEILIYGVMYIVKRISILMGRYGDKVSLIVIAELVYMQPLQTLKQILFFGGILPQITIGLLDVVRLMSGLTI